MANMTFKANLLPNSDLGYSLGSSDKKWNVYGTFKGNADSATKLATARTISLTGSVTGSGTFDGSGNLSITTTTNHNHDGRYLQYNGWWSSGNGNNVDDANGMVFAYNSHGTPGTWGILTTFDYQKDSAYRHQIFADGYNSEMYFRVRSSDRGGWYGGWKRLVYNSGTWGISITGNAATATALQTARTINGTSFNGSANITTANWGTARTLTIGSTGKSVNGSGNVSWSLSEIGAATASHSHGDYVLKNSTYNGNLNSLTTSGFYRINNGQANAPSDWGQILVCHGNSDTIFQLYGHYADGHFAGRAGNPSEVGGSGVWSAWRWFWMQGDSVTGAVWNDYAEYRESDSIEPGYILCEKGDGSLYKSTKRCQEFAGVSSDTWGFAQGETEKAKTPIAVSGRVLVYIKDKVKVNDYICSGPDGIGLKMHWWEKILYPHRVVGIVSEIPTYEKWGGGDGADRDPVDVNGRIWIKCCN